MRILVCAVQTPLVRGGAELHIAGIERALREHGHEVATVSMPYRSYPATDVTRYALAWRLLDLTEVEGKPVDRLICTKFPTYYVDHPTKVTWLLHQERSLFDLYATPYSGADGEPHGPATRDAVHAADARALLSCRAVYANSRNVAARLWRSLGLESEPLYHPPPLAGRYRCDEYGGFLLCVSRLEPIKRVRLALEALALSRVSLPLYVVGRGSEEAALHRLAADLGIDRRVRFLGFVPDEELLDLYARCRAVIFPPYDEDYGYITLEAFSSRKPLITTGDAGGVLEFAVNGENAWVCPPAPEAVAEAIDATIDAARCRRMGEAGHARVAPITWDHVVERLLV